MSVTVGSVSTFDVGFGVFVVAFVVLAVLIMRFAFKWNSVAMTRWRADHGPSQAEPAKTLTALVLAGGGTRGAAQVGMLQVLAEHGIVPDMVFGTSVGAVNGAAFAGDPTEAGVAHLAEVWRGLRGEVVYPESRLHGMWRFLQHRDAVHPSTGLRRIVEESLKFDRLEDFPVRFEVTATSLTDGTERWLTSGSTADAILASAAIPAIFPPMEIDGELLIDGGVVDNVPIMRAVDAGAERIIVLLCGPEDYHPPPSRRPIEAMLTALFIAVHARFHADMKRMPPGVEVIVCGVETAQTRDYTDFSDTEALIDAGRAAAVAVFGRSGLITGDATEHPSPAAAAGDDTNATDGNSDDDRAPSRIPEGPSSTRLPASDERPVDAPVRDAGAVTDPPASAAPGMDGLEAAVDGAGTVTAGVDPVEAGGPVPD